MTQVCSNACFFSRSCLRSSRKLHESTRGNRKLDTSTQTQKLVNLFIIHVLYSNGEQCASRRVYVSRKHKIYFAVRTEFWFRSNMFSFLVKQHVKVHGMLRFYHGNTISICLLDI